MVSATSPEVTRMVLASGTNKWASRAVVILQLAAWSAVGIVLLQKGVSSLQKRPSETRNVTQVVPVKSLGSYRQDNQKDLLVTPVDNESNSKIQREKKLNFDDEWSEGIRDTDITNDEEFYFSSGKQNLHNKVIESNSENYAEEPRVMESVDGIVKKNYGKEITKEELMGKKLYHMKKTGKTDMASKDIDEFINSSDNSKDPSSPSRLMNNKKLSSVDVDTDESQRQRTKMIEENPLSVNSQQLTNSNSTFENFMNNESKITTQSSTITTKSGGAWESRRRLRLSHLSGGGAAAAVAMVAVGAVMLVLGPAVIVLRALDERRQERRFLKLSGRDDLPPSYEQATLMDEAPRYSSLSLNTILGPPPPPSPPTPARVHIV